MARIFLSPRVSRIFIAFHHQKILVLSFGGNYFEREIWEGTASSTNIVGLPRRRVDTAGTFVHVITRVNRLLS